MDTLGIYPKMSSSGFVTNPESIAKELLTVPFVSNASQSSMYAGEVSSMGHVLQQAGADKDAFAEGIRAMYTRLFRRYFSEVEVTVEDSEEDSAVVILDIRYGDGSESGRLTQGILNDNNTIKLSNFGET